MKSRITFFACISFVIMSYAQSQSEWEGPNADQDEFTYKKIDILEAESGNLPLSGAGSNPDSETGDHSTANTDSGIGETQGYLSVSLTGGATYEVPIAVPPGINGIVPEVSLAYNSQGGNGLAGYGWNINGVSVISRIPATSFHDDGIDGVDFDNMDRFALDGERLILKSGTYGGNGAVYETETFSNLKIISHGVSPYGASYGPAYFVVFYPDGSLAYYGNGSNSRSRTNYSITYWQNPQGVRISYEYSIDNNSQSISKIKYGSINSNTPLNEIRFNYVNNNRRWEQAYINNISFVRSKILNQIEVYSENTRYKYYNLYYENYTRLKYERLRYIREYSGDGSSYHDPIWFSYSTSDSSVDYDGITTELGLLNIEQRNAETVSLDLTGNGKMDFIVTPRTNRNKFWIFKDIQSEEPNYPSEVNTGGFYESVFPTIWLNHHNRILAGQGLTVVQNGTNGSVDFKVYSNGITNPLYYQYTKSWNAPRARYESCGTTYYNNIPRKYVSGDFNGDGLTDVLAINNGSYYERYCAYVECDGEDPRQRSAFGRRPPGDGERCCDCTSYNRSNIPYTYFIDLDRNLNSGFAGYSGRLQQTLSADDKLIPINFNDDGKTDILHVTDGSLFVYTLDESNRLDLLWQTTDAEINTDDPLLFGDYNGDAKTDFLDPVNNGSYSFRVFLSTGTTFVNQTRTMPFKYQRTNWNGNNGVLSGYNLVPLDINGDGRTDIIEYNTTTYNDHDNGTQAIKIYNNYGLDGSPSTPTSLRFVYGGSATKTGNLMHYPIPIYLSSNQPNKNLEFASISNQWVTQFSFTQDHREDVLLRSISNNGVTLTIGYNNLDPDEYNKFGTQVYESAYEVAYPYVDIEVAPGTKVVTSLERECSGTPTLRQELTYQGAVYHAEGLGFQGFKGIGRSNWHTDHADRIYNMSLYDPLLRGAVTDEFSRAYTFTFIVPSSGYITKTNYVNASSLSADKVFKISVSSSSTHNMLDGTTTGMNYLYDTYNNPTRITTDFSGQGSSSLDLTYANNPGSGYYIGRITNQQETSTIGGESFNAETRYAYSGYLLSRKSARGDGTAFDHEDYYYDAYGNIIKQVFTPNASSPREIRFEYDSSGRFLTKSIDVEGLETTYEYNTTTGTLTRETDHFGLQTNYQYDAWNRLTTLTDYLGNAITTTYVESGYSYTVTDTGDDGSGQITIYDPLKRVTEIKEKNILGQWVSISYQYDKFDRLWKESEPYIGSSATQWNETEYDFYGRPIRYTAHTGRTTNLSYNGLTVTVDDGVKIVTATLDAVGNTVSATDPGGTINYTYFGNGNLKTTNYGGLTTSIERDGWGRKTRLTDPSAGEYTYTYNGFGEILSETTPKGQTDYVYSPLGKLTQKTITGDHTNMVMGYTYDPTHKFLSALSLTDSGGNNSGYNYTYDGYLRLTGISENNTYAQFAKTYTYDSFGRIDTEEYDARLLANGRSSTRKIRFTYQNGGLKTLNDYATGEILWNISGLNARGQVTTATMGNELRLTNTYDDYGYLTRNKVVKNVSSSPVEIMQLNNNFDFQRGILNSRTSSLFSWSENFGYDTLDRLISFADNDGSYAHTYDDRGRITDNTTIGEYGYTGNSYQISEIALNGPGMLHYESNPLQQVAYNAFKKPVEITEDGSEKVSFLYNAFGDRSHIFYGDMQDDPLLRNSRKHYSYDGGMEISHDNTTGKTLFIFYAGGDAYSAPAIWRSEQGGTTSEAWYYLHRDYLGSILMISDKDGNVVEKRHFDAWGGLVKLTDGDGTDLDKFVYLDRGYTGHEHLQGVTLVHMNGRLYDPKLRRFLSPDNYIQDIGNTQSFNRYGYVLNNPLMYIDPSGEIGIETLGGPWGIAIGGLISSAALLNWKSVGNWVSTNFKSAIRDIGNAFREVGRFFRRLFGGGRKKVAPVVHNNPTNLVSDPLAGSSANTPVSFFGGGGTSSGGLGIDGTPGSKTPNEGKPLFEPKHMLSQSNPETSNRYGPFTYRWANSDSLVGRLTYSMANDGFQVIQTFDFDLIRGSVNPLTGKRANINIDGTPNYYPVSGFVNTLTTFVPFVRGLKSVTSVLPRGLGYINKLNAAQFSHVFKGNLSRLVPKIRGYINRLLNRGIHTYNNNIASGLIFLKTMSIFGDD